MSHKPQTPKSRLTSTTRPWGGAITAVVVVFAEYGREYFWIPVVGVMLVLGDRNTKLLALELAALFLVGIAFGELLKIAVYRPRPFVSVDGIVTRVVTDLDSSFPSGHALIVSIGAAFSMLKFKRRIVGLVFVLEAAVVCYSRVYVGDALPPRCGSWHLPRNRHRRSRVVHHGDVPWSPPDENNHVSNKGTEGRPSRPVVPFYSLREGHAEQPMLRALRGA